jgi:hypothetical protein
MTLRASLAVLATRMVVSILPAGATELLAVFVVLALVDLPAAGLVMDFFDTAMVLFLAFKICV